MNVNLQDPIILTHLSRMAYTISYDLRRFNYVHDNSNYGKEEIVPVDR